MSTRLIPIGLVILAVLLAGCGANGTATPGSSPTATPLPTLSYQEAATVCKGLPSISGADERFYRLGDVLVTVGSYYGIASRRLPDSTTLSPLLTPDPNDSAALDARFPSQPPIFPTGNSTGLSGVAFTLCNASQTQTHTLEGVKIRIQRFTPYTGRIQTWTECDGYYTRSDPHGVVGGGCGGGIHADEILQANYPANATAGAELAASWVSASEQPTDSTRTAPWGPLPAQIPAGQYLVLLVTGSPMTSGVYTLALAPMVDNARLPFVPVRSPAFFAANPQQWTGQACLTQTMQAQIPAATTPPSYYICPEA